jgi:hypothetical protein
MDLPIPVRPDEVSGLRKRRRKVEHPGQTIPLETDTQHIVAAGWETG